MEHLPTTNKRIKSSYTWKVENKSQLILNNEWRSSPLFTTNVNGEVLKWKLELKLRIEAPDVTSMMFVLRSLSDNSTEVAVGYTVQLEDKKGQIATRKTEFDYDCRKKIYSTYLEMDFGFLLNKRYQCTSLEDYLVTIVCHIFFDVPTTSECHEPSVCCRSNHAMEDSREDSSMPSDSESECFNVGDMTDLTVLSKEGDKFRAHKQMFMLRSDVFSSVFFNDVRNGKKDGHLKFTDANSELVREVLRFMYTGQVQDLRKHRKDLTQLARKYGIDSLTKFCKVDDEQGMSTE